MRVTRSCKEGHHCCVAAQRSSVGSGPVDDEVEAAAVVGWDACCGRVGTAKSGLTLKKMRSTRRRTRAC